jgi:hypothetical protein
MGYEETSKFCGYCNRQVLARRQGTNHILHLLLTIVTGGLWLIIWILISVKIGGWRCSSCGQQVNMNFIPKPDTPASKKWRKYQFIGGMIFIFGLLGVAYTTPPSAKSYHDSISGSIISIVTLAGFITLIYSSILRWWCRA